MWRVLGRDVCYPHETGVEASPGTRRLGGLVVEALKLSPPETPFEAGTLVFRWACQVSTLLRCVV